MTFHCLLCGEELREKMLEKRSRWVCPRCGWIYYPQLKVTAGVLIEESGKILLVQRALEPWKGFWYLPAGYIEVDEDPLAGALREVKEETGLDVRITNLRSISMYQDDPRGNGILIIYNGKWVGGSLCTSSESMAVKFFLPREIQTLPLAGSSHTLAVQQWVQEKESEGCIGSEYMG